MSRLFEFFHKLLAPRVTITRIYSQPMTAEQERQMDEAFKKMDEAFDEMRKAFRL